VLPERLIEPEFKYKSAFDVIVPIFNVPLPTILMSFVQIRPLEISDPVVFVVRSQNPDHPVNVGFTEPLRAVETVMDGKAH
jgi:hypothetical protein